MSFSFLLYCVFLEKSEESYRKDCFYMILYPHNIKVKMSNVC